jgi:hypothetical protein
MRPAHLPPIPSPEQYAAALSAIRTRLLSDNVNCRVLPHDRILLWQRRCLTNVLTQPHQKSYHTFKIFKRPSRSMHPVPATTPAERPDWTPSGTGRATASPVRRSACPFRRVVACAGRARGHALPTPLACLLRLRHPGRCPPRLDKLASPHPRKGGGWGVGWTLRLTS